MRLSNKFLGKTAGLALAAAVISGAMAGSASAAVMDYTFSGTFATDDDVQVFNFSLDAANAVTLFSSSWISGDSGMGFDPILAVWAADGTLMQQQDDGGNTGSTWVNGVQYFHGTWDTYFTTGVLAAGDYFATIGQFNNFANTGDFADGFRHDGNPNFTFDNGYGPQAMFNGVWSSGDARTGDWEFHLLGVTTADTDVPAPAALGLIGFGLIALGLGRRRLKK